MSQTALAYEHLVEAFIKWGEAQPDIRAAIVVGSRARVEHPADEWSDLDLVIVAANPRRYLTQSDWLDRLGTPWVTFCDKTSTGEEQQRRVIFEGGLDVDCAFIPQRLARTLVFLVRILKRLPRLFQLPYAARLMRKAEGFCAMVRRGIRVLLDKDGLAEYLKLFDVAAPPVCPPAESEFLEVVNGFWYHAVWTAKHIRRGEIWWAKSACDERMKHWLRQMTEWHARARNGWQYDTWMRGRFLEEWADPRAVKELEGAFAHYSEADLRRALLATMDLFRWLAVETASLLKYPYPATADQRITAWVKDCLSEGDAG